MSNNTSEQPELEDSHILDHPEVRAIFDDVLTILVTESDRGAVLVGASVVEAQMETFFRKIALPGISKKGLKDCLDFSGPLGTFSSRIELAYMLRLISPDLRKSMRTLRKLRNNVAHSPKSFRLEDHKDQLREMFQLGPGVPAGVNQLAMELMLSAAVGRMLEIEKPHDSNGEKIFQNPEEVLAHLESNPELLEGSIGRHQPKWELGLGIALLCGLLVYYRDEAVKRLGPGLLIAQPLPDKATEIGRRS